MNKAIFLNENIKPSAFIESKGKEIAYSESKNRRTEERVIKG